MIYHKQKCCSICGEYVNHVVTLGHKEICYECYRDYDFEVDASWEDVEEEEYE